MRTSLPTLLLFVTTSVAAACSSGSGAVTPPPADGGAEVGTMDAPEEPSPPDSGAPDAPGDSPIDASDSGPPCAVHGDSAAPITVHGGVVSVFTGLPTMVKVTIGSQTTTTAADGSFTIPCVVPPYDVTIDDVGADRHQTFVGLTRPDPSLAIFSTETPEPTYPQQQISGALTIGGSTIDAGMSNAFMVIMDGQLDLGDTHGSTFDFITYLPTPPPLALTLYGFTYTPSATGGLASIDAFGTEPVTANGHAISVGIPLAASNVVASTLSGTLSLPAGATTPKAWLYLGNGVTFPVATDTPGSTFSYATFQSPLHWILMAGATLPDGSQCDTYLPGLAGSENLSVVVPSGSTVTSPSSATFNPATQDFAWSHVPGTVHLVSIIGYSASPAYFVVTDRDSVRLPFTLASGMKWNWSVQTIAPAASIDAITASTKALQVLSPVWAPTVAQSACSVGGSFTL
jgi:hypothetical protein